MRESSPGQDDIAEYRGRMVEVQNKVVLPSDFSKKITSKVLAHRPTVEITGRSRLVTAIAKRYRMVGCLWTLYRPDTTLCSATRLCKSTTRGSSLWRSMAQNPVLLMGSIPTKTPGIFSQSFGNVFSFLSTPPHVLRTTFFRSAFFPYFHTLVINISVFSRALSEWIKRLRISLSVG